MDLVLELTIKIMILAAIGFAAAKAGIIDDTGKEKLSSLLVNLLLPVSMIASSQQPFGMEHLKGAGSIVCIALIYYFLAFVIGIAVGRLTKMNADRTAMFTLLITFANTGFIGMPLLGQVIGETGTFYGAIYNSVFDVLYFSVGIYVLQGRENGHMDSRSCLCNPMIGIAIITVFLYVLPWRFPTVITDSLTILGDCMMPVSMLIIGAEIAGMKVKRVLTDRASYGVSLFRMFLCPMITFCVMKLLHVEFEVAATAVVLCAMPSASLNVIMGQKYKNNAEFAAAAVMQNTMIMIGTLPFFTFLCENLLS